MQMNRNNRSSVGVAGAFQKIRNAPEKISLSMVFSVMVTVMIAIYFMIAEPDNQHWFVIPVILCGVVVGIDAIDWLRGKMNIFDPFGFVGLFGYHFFFLCPLLHVYWHYWSLFVLGSTQPPDYRPWLGGMAFLNFLGLLIYRAVRSIPWEGKKKPEWRVWKLNTRNASIVIPLLLFVLTLMQGIMLWQRGGISGFLQSYGTDRARAFDGMGWFFTLTDSVPILMMMGYALLARNKPALRTWTVLALVALAFFVLQIFFGGLRGSRSNTIFALFWALGIIHFWVRRIPKQVIFAGFVFLMGFMYIYRFYKHGGTESLQMLGTQQGQEMLERYSGNTTVFTLLTDLGRSDMQAFILYRLNRPQTNFDYAYGRTYLAAPLGLIPRAIWPDRLPTKMKEGTEIQQGKGSYRDIKTASSRVYGLAAEAMLNFGPIAVPFAFAVYGLAVGYIRRLMLRLSPEDIRFLIYPLLVNLCFNMIVGDSDNICFFLMKNGLVPFLVLFVCSRRLKQTHTATEGRESMPMAMVGAKI
jgi:hypothetical protein